MTSTVMAFGINVMMGAQAAAISPTPIELIRQAEALACGVNEDACLPEEFRLRRAADQKIRTPGVDEALCEEAAVLSSCREALWHQIDDNNLRRLKIIFEARGWPPLGGEVEESMWLIAQHAGIPNYEFR